MWVSVNSEVKVVEDRREIRKDKELDTIYNRLILHEVKLAKNASTTVFTLSKMNVTNCR